MSSAVEVDAPAKINLLLRVLGTRPDGFHDLETLFQAVDLCDRVRIERSARGVALEVAGAELGFPEDNLAYRAAARLLSEVGTDEGLKVTLTKRIPVGAGLGGGSSDAAAVLRGVSFLLGLPEDDGRVARIAAGLGSDVPFFLGRSPLALGCGRGELLEPCAPLPTAHLVLVSPPVHVSTPWAYRALDEARGAERRAHAGTGPAHVGRPADPARLARPASWADVVAQAHNDFQDVVAAAHPEVARALGALQDAGAHLALMSGSGSTSFGLFSDGAAAKQAAGTLAAALGWPCRAVRTLGAFPAPNRLY